MVVQFVGFLDGYRNPGALPPLTAATLAAVLTVWVTFVPCFLWIFLGGPFIERLRTNRSLATALAAITAGFVGVIVNLAVWFMLHTIFRNQQRLLIGRGAIELPAVSSVNVEALVLAVAIFAVFRLKLSTFLVRGRCAAIGVAFSAGGVVA